MAAQEPMQSLLDRLQARGVVPPHAAVHIEPLVGGVSADVFRVSFENDRLVVKLALPRLRVAQDWRSSPTRVLLEADAIRCAGAIRPDNVPEVVDVDEDGLVIVLTAAPEGMANWKMQLLEGAIDPGVGASLGAALSDWHSKTSADPEVLSRFAQNHFFDLRISPFFLRVADVHPDLAPRIDEIVAHMTAKRTCLVHGDFSPKNVLVGDGSFWVLDWETAHCGDPAFDLAFLLSHLACKAIHRPEDRARYQTCAEAFLSTYRDRATVPLEMHAVVAQAGCLVLARVDGKSPVDYFDEPEREAARVLGRSVALADIDEPAALFETPPGQSAPEGRSGGRLDRL